MAFAGLRVAEVASLRAEDVTVTARRGLVQVRHSKGDLSRAVPLPAEARAAVSTWLVERPDDGPWLFPGPDDGHLTVRALHRAVRGAAGVAGIDASPHAVRHTFVTRLVRRGTDLTLVADLAGHRRIETTRLYALPSEHDRQMAVDALNIDY